MIDAAIHAILEEGRGRHRRVVLHNLVVISNGCQEQAAGTKLARDLL
jgi:hypothetical protein